MSTTTASSAPNHQQQQPQNSSSTGNQFYVPRNVIESVIQNLDGLISATSVAEVLEHRRQIAKLLRFEESGGIRNFFRLKGVLFTVKSLSKWNRVAAILKALDLKAAGKEYALRGKMAEKRILVIGGGISGLRAAIECLLIGAKVICVEKRDEFSRNNVIHLWPNVINDLYTFEGKRLYGQFCVGSIDHVSIRQLQLMLLKIAVILGVTFVPNIAFEEICPRIIEPKEAACSGADSCSCCCHVHGFGGGAYAHFSSPSSPAVARDLSRQSFDVIIGCDGRRNTFSRYFPRNNRRGKLAIGLTANYVNRRTEEEAHCPEISGISRIYNQKWFKDLQEETGIELENIVYYRDETHYFVMTATKGSLLRRGVLRADYGDSHQLLSNSNIDISLLMRYSKDAAEWSSKLRRLEFALNSSHKPDVALFDFTSMYSATNASCAKRIHLNCCSGEHGRKSSSATKYTLMLLCGDSLLEPFWPTGSGAGRGFLSALDAAWAVSLWYSNVRDEFTTSTSADHLETMLNVISRREYVYRLLAQTSPENTTPKGFTLDPATRYKNLNLRDSKTLTEIKAQVRHLIIDRSDLDMKTYVSNYETKRARRATVGINPEDVLKASALTAVSASSAAYKQTYNLDENYNSSTENRDRLSPRSKPIYAVPLSPTLNHALPLNCDNSTSVAHNFEVIERRPKNPNADFELTSSSLYGALDQQTSNSGSSRPTSPRGDFRPRNEAQQLQQQKYYQKDEELQRKDYQARNHFILNANNEDSNLEKPSSFSGYHHHYQTENKENSFYAQHQQPNRNLPSDPQSRSSYYGGSASSQSQKSTAAQNRSSLHFPSSSSSALSSQFTDPTSKLYDFGNYDDHQLSEEESNRQAAREYGNSKQPYSWASRAAFLRDFAERNSRRHELSAMEQHQQAHQPQPRSPKNKPTGSSEIIEKAIYLEQKFEEQRKPYQPTLSKVGKIEDEDWNVKIWNSEEIFAPKPAERRNMVHDNSKALLQSRITQLHNNFTSSSAKDEILRGTGVGERNRSSDYVSMLSNEVASKFSGGNGSSRSSRLTNSTTTASLKTSSAAGTAAGAEPLASVQLLKANNASGGGGGVDLTDSESSAAAFRRTTTTAPSNLKTVELLLQPSGVECKRCSRPITAFDRVSVLGQNYHRTCLTCKVCSIMLRQDELLSEEFSCKLCRSSSRLHGFSSAAAASSSSAAFSATPLTTSFSSAAVANIDSSNGNGNSNNARSSFFDPVAAPPMSVSLIEAKKNFLVNIEQIDLRERAEFEIMDEGKDDLDVAETTTMAVNGQATDSSSSEPKVRGSPNKHQTTPEQDDDEELSESDPNSSSSANHSDTNYTDDEHSESDVAAVDLEDSKKRSFSSSATKKEKEALDEKEEVVSLPAVLPEDESEFAALMKEPPLPLLCNGEEVEKEEEENEDANEVVVDEELCRSNYQEQQQLEKSLDDDDGRSPMIADHQIELSNSTNNSSSSSSSMKEDNDCGDDDDSMLPPSELPPPPPPPSAPGPDSSLPPDSLATTTTITSACFSSTSNNTVNSSSVDSCSDSDGPPSPAPPLPPPSPPPPVDNHSSPPSSPPSPPPPQPPPQLPPLMTQSFTTANTNNHRQPLQAPPPYRNPFESYTPSSALQQPFSSLVYPESKNSPSAVRPAPLPPPPTSLPTSNRMFATLDHSYHHHRTSGLRDSNSTDSTAAAAAPTLNWRSSLLSNSSKNSSQEEENKSRRPHSGKLPVTSGAPIRGGDNDNGDGDNGNELDPAALPPRYRYSGAFTEKFYRTLSQPTLYEQLQHIDRKLKSARAGAPAAASHEVPFADGGGNSGSKGAPNASSSSNAPVASIEDV